MSAPGLGIAAGGALPPRHSASGLSALPPRQGADGPSAVRGQTGGTLLAWQREMERAQAVDWFRSAPPAITHGTPGTPGRVPRSAAETQGCLQRAIAPAGRTVAVAADSRQRLASNNDEAAPALAGVSALAVRAGALSAAASDSQESPAGAPLQEPVVMLLAGPDVGVRSASRDPTVPLPAAQSDAQSALAGAPPRAPQPAVSAAAPVLRIHEEAQAQGQAVWLAMHADDAALGAALPRLVGELRREMALRGQSLWQVVCNGRLVWRDSAHDAQDTHDPHGTHGAHGAHDAHGAKVPSFIPTPEA